MPRTPLTSRPLDLVYTLFFAIHIPATLLLDCQSLYPAWLLPAPLAALPRAYVAQYGDPLIGGLFGFFGDAARDALEVWLRPFMVLEAVFQLPVFILGIKALYNDDPSVYPLLLAYGASTATTTLPCIVAVLRTPLLSQPYVLEDLMGSAPAITPAQRAMLLVSYVPFLLVPLAIAVDMARRCARYVRAGVRAERERKGR